MKLCKFDVAIMPFRHNVELRIMFKSCIFALGVLKKNRIVSPMLHGVHFLLLLAFGGDAMLNFLTPPEREYNKIKFSGNVQTILSFLYFSMFVGRSFVLTCFGSAHPIRHGGHIFRFFWWRLIAAKQTCQHITGNQSQDVICIAAIHAQTNTLLLAFQVARNLCWVLHVCVCVIPIAGWTEKLDCYHKNNFSDQASTRSTST